MNFKHFKKPASFLFITLFIIVFYSCEKKTEITTPQIKESYKQGIKENNDKSANKGFTLIIPEVLSTEETLELTREFLKTEHFKLLHKNSNRSNSFIYNEESNLFYVSNFSAIQPFNQSETSYHLIAVNDVDGFIFNIIVRIHVIGGMTMIVTDS